MSSTAQSFLDTFRFSAWRRLSDVTLMEGFSCKAFLSKAAIVVRLWDGETWFCEYPLGSAFCGNILFVDFCGFSLSGNLFYACGFPGSRMLRGAEALGYLFAGEYAAFEAALSDACLYDSDSYVSDLHGEEYERLLRFFGLSDEKDDVISGALIWGRNNTMSSHLNRLFDELDGYVSLTKRMLYADVSSLKERFSDADVLREFGGGSFEEVYDACFKEAMEFRDREAMCMCRLTACRFLFTFLVFRGSVSKPGAYADVDSFCAAVDDVTVLCEVERVCAEYGLLPCSFSFDMVLPFIRGDIPHRSLSMAVDVFDGHFSRFGSDFSLDLVRMHDDALYALEKEGWGFKGREGMDEAAWINFREDFAGGE